MNGTFFCNKCGAQNAADAQFCNRCGASTFPTPGVAPTAAQPINAASGTAAPYAASSPAYPATRPLVGFGYGGFWIRVVAAIVDGVLVRVVVTPIGAVFGLSGLALGGFGHGFRLMHLMGGGAIFL